MITIGEKIRQLRQKTGDSQKVIAQKLSISVPAYSKIETGHTTLHMKRIDQLATLFNVSSHHIISPDEQLLLAPVINEIERLKAKIHLVDQEIIKLQIKVIALYEESRDSTKKQE